MQAEVVVQMAAFMAPSVPHHGWRDVAYLTAQDRIAVTRCQDAARAAGYDRLVIHERDSNDALDIENFLSVHRRGEAWSRWGFARIGDQVRAWCCLSGVDVGEFSSLDEAFAAVLNCKMPEGGTLVDIKVPTQGAKVTNLAAVRFARQLGSAA